jgi:hypothetical protein
MAIYKNKSGQKLAVFATDSSGVAKTGHAASISAQISLDGAACAATSDVNPAELDAADAPGIYLFDLSLAETAADLIIVASASTTAGVIIRPVIAYTEPERRTADLDTIKTQAVTCGAAVTVRADVGTASVSTPQTADVASLITTVGTAGAGLTGVALSAAGITAIWAYVIEGTITAVQAVRGILATTLGKVSGGGTTTVVIRDASDTKTRVTATVDLSGNRSAITKDLT